MSKEGSPPRKTDGPPEAKPERAKEPADPAAEESDHPAVEFGIAAIGEDDSAYLLRRTSPATIYVVSPAGEVTRTLKIDAGNKGLMPVALQVAEKELLIMFSDYTQHLIIAANPNTGEVQREYIGGNELGAAFGCYTDGEFYFVTADKGLLAISRAAPR